MAWVATIIAGVVSAYATYETSQQQAKYQEYGAKVSRNQAEAARQTAAVAAENQRDEDRRVMAAQRARIGQAGVLGDVGSPLLAQMESAETAALNEARIRWSGDVQAGGHFAEEIGARYQAKATRRTGYLATGTTLLSGSASTYRTHQYGARKS